MYEYIGEIKFGEKKKKSLLTCLWQIVLELASRHSILKSLQLFKLPHNIT